MYMYMYDVVRVFAVWMCVFMYAWYSCIRCMYVCTNVCKHLEKTGKCETRHVGVTLPNTTDWLIDWQTHKHTYSHGDRLGGGQTRSQKGLCRMRLARLVQTCSFARRHRYIKASVPMRESGSRYYVHFNNYRMLASWICMRQTLPTQSLCFPLMLFLQQFVMPSGVFIPSTEC